MVTLATPRSPTKRTGFIPFYDIANLRIVGPLSTEIWSAIRLFSIHSVYRNELARRHPSLTVTTLDRIATRGAACVRQADEYYALAAGASPSVAPLLHYYSMLNLAKGLLFLASPSKLRTANDFAHGLTDADRLKNLSSFGFWSAGFQTRPGIFSALFALLTGSSLPARTRLRLGTLLRYCALLGNELERVNASSLLAHVGITWCEDKAAIWLRGYVNPPERLKRHAFEKVVPEFLRLFHPVQSDAPSSWAYETNALGFSSIAERNSAVRVIMGGASNLNLYWSGDMDADESDVGIHLLPLEHPSNRILPEPCTILAIMFYLGSMVRYQPHIFEHLLGSSEAWILEGFIRQCPIAYAHALLNQYANRWHEFESI